MSNPHSPGPWKIANPSPHRGMITIQDEGGNIPSVAKVLDSHGSQDANARLIAAAPELLDAVGELICSLDAIYPDLETELMSSIENSTSVHGANLIDSYRLAVNAIAKAEGGAK